MRKTLLSAALAGALAAAGGTALAQSDRTFDQETLEAFAEAVVAVEEVRSGYATRFQAAGTDEERQRIGGEAQQAMIAAVEQNPDIDVDTYNQIAMAAQQDPELARRISGLIQEAAQEHGVAGPATGSDAGSGGAAQRPATGEGGGAQGGTR